MANDIAVRKLFGVGLLGLMGLAAYFQAAGASSLLGVSLASTQAPAFQRTVVGTNKVAVGKRSAEAILNRNAFDSITGPLVGKEAVFKPPVGEETESKDPLSAPTCEGMRLSIVSEATDPVWSLAAVQAPGETAPQMRRVGERVGGKTIAYIGYNPLHRTPAVWMEESGASLCQSLLFAVQPPVSAAPPPAKPAGSGGPAGIPDPPRRGSSKAPPEILAKIQRVGETEYLIDRSVIDQIIERQAELMRLRIVPDLQGGQTVGLRLYGIRPDTVAGALGLENADRLESINGFSMASPEKVLEVYARLRSAEALKMQINRRGKTLSIDYKIK